MAEVPLSEEPLITIFFERLHEFFLLQALPPALAARQAVPGIRGSVGRSRRYFSGRRGEALEDRSPLYRSFDVVASIQFMPAITGLKLS